MRTASPILSFPPGLAPSSPPHTPTAPSPPPFYAPKISSGPASGPGGFSPPIVPASLSQPPHVLPFTTDRINFDSPLRSQELSPYSSHSSDADISEPEPELSNDEDSRPGSPSPQSAQQARMEGDYVHVHKRVTVRANFVIEELSDFDEDDMIGRTDIIHPYTIEYAESDRPPAADAILADLQNLQCRSPDPGLSSCGSSDEFDEDVHEVMLQAVRERERRHRMSKSSGTKRTMSERGSDASADREDLVRGYLGFEEVGSSARRLRQRIAGDRRSLVFQDPPPRIEEVVEPEELDETLARELPFYEYTSMHVDSPRSPYD